MALARIRNRIQALQRIYALPLTVMRLRPLATQFCDQWAVARDQRQPLPETHPFVIKLVDAGIRLPSFGFLGSFFNRHREAGTCPHPESIVNTLLPHAAARDGIISATFRWDPPATASG